MIGERENKHTNTEYGVLSMRSYDISGNDINAFYDDSGELVFVLDNTINNLKPNVLLVINPDGDRKWDEILSNDYDVDLETIRPKQDNKYQKLDIEYSGLNVYDKLLNAYDDGDDINDLLNQLNVLRDSAMRHSAMVRLSVANEIIAKTNATIVKTKETIVRLTERIKALRANLSETKKEIGRVSTKQSASKILKLESQIEANNEKLKRAKKRLASAQKRLEMATVDAELAEELLNQPALQTKTEGKRVTKKSKSLMIAPKHDVKKIEPENDDDFDEDDYDMDDEENTEDENNVVAQDDKDNSIDADEDDDATNNGVKPLFDQDPEILDENIAFKPISFDVPQSSKQITPSSVTENEPVLVAPKLDDVFFAPEVTESVTEKPMLESITPINNVPELPQTETLSPYATSFVPEITESVTEKPMLESITPINNIPELPQPETPKIEIPVLKDAFVASDINTYDEPVEKVVKNMENKRPVLETMISGLRQDELVNTENMTRPTGPLPVVSDNKLVAPMTESMHDEMMQSDNKHKPNFVYYMLLLILIVLSVFTLWLYQRNTTNGEVAPMLTASVEQSSAVKKLEKTQKTAKPSVVKETEPEEAESVFVDMEQPTTNIDQVSVADEEINEEEIFDEQTANTEPVIMDAVPARVNTSGGTVDEDETESTLTEQDVLANKPVYEPGAKHDEMFIVDDNDVMSESNDDYVDAEEMAVYEDNTNIELDVAQPTDDVFYAEEESVDDGNTEYTEYEE